jgi:hypothetical protein
MIGPVSGTGRAMMASLQQAMQKGMPPDQAIQYVKSMATQGVAPLADLYAMMNQFQRLKQQPVQPPQTPPTIRDELNMMEQMQAQGGMPPQMPGGGGGPQMPPQMPQQMPPQMAQGLGSMNAGAMENPSFAGGGIVAFQKGGPAEIDFSKMSSEQLDALIRGDDVEVARAALQERLNRSGYVTPSDLLSRYTGAVRAGAEEFSKGPLIKFDNSRKFPSYMYDEEGNVRQGDVTGGIAGTKYFSSSREAPPAAAPEVAAAQSAVPGTSAANPFANPAAAGNAFDAMVEQARAGVRQDVAPPRRAAEMPSMGGFQRMELPVAKSRDQFYEELKTAQEKEGIGEALKKREAYLTNEEARLKKEYGSDKMLAFAEAGFKMAGAASRPGATFFGALSEGAISGTQALRALNKEQRASRRAMDEARFQLAEAAEQRKLGNMKDATILASRAQDKYDEAQKYNMALENDIEKLRITTGAQFEAARISAGERAENRALAGKSFQLQSLQAQIDNAQKRLAQAAKSLEPDAVKAPKIAKLEQEIAFYNDQIAKLGGTQAYAGAMGTESAIPDAVLQALNKYR